MKVPKTPPSAKAVPAKKRTFTRKNFNSLLLNGNEFKLGDVVIIKEATDERSYGRILRIWRDPIDENQAFIHLRWFYKPVDVFDSVPGFVGADELFESDHEQDVYVQTICGKIRVVSMEEYLAMSNLEDDVFFTRAVYSPATKTLEPPVLSWACVCTCRSTLSPNDSYLVCQRCASRFHPTCVKLSPSAEEWTCEDCRDTRE